MEPTFENFVTSKNKECALCFDDITKDNYAFYNDNEELPNSEWIPCKYCSACIQDSLDNQWSIYVQQLKNETCVATLKRLIEDGPPINFRDKRAVPCNNPTGEVYEFYYNGDQQQAKLKDSLIDNERSKYIDELNKMYKLLQFATGDNITL